MELKSYVASYYGPAAQAMRCYLTPEVLDVVARVAEAPVQQGELDADVYAELGEMHVFTERNGCIALGTAVFLEDDLQRVNQTVVKLAEELVDAVIPAAAPLAGESAAVVNFLVGIIGIGQNLHHALKDEQIVVNWKEYGGKYRQSKADFEQVCDAAALLGPDLQYKSFLKSAYYTAALIGPGAAGPAFHLKPADVNIAAGSDYVWQINRFLTDAFAMLIAGKFDHPELVAAAHRAGLFVDGKPDTVVLTRETVEKYIPAITEIGQISTGWYKANLGAICRLLEATTSGRQGVPPGNMMMHLWRYQRRAIARALYDKGLFTDRVPQTGLLTLFYENDIDILRELLA